MDLTVYTWPKGTGGDTESKVAPADFPKISLNLDWKGSTCSQLKIPALLQEGPYWGPGCPFLRKA